LKPSIPLYRLKRQAKVVSRQQKVPLHEALDRIAASEGFSTWSLLAASANATSPAARLYAVLKPGDLLLIAARPGQGKTFLSMQLVLEAIKSGNRAVFFTLEYTVTNFVDCLNAVSADWHAHRDRLWFDDSEAISADHIVKNLAAAEPNTLAVIDYLQLLDQRRDKPELAHQIGQLKAFARKRGVILVFISQIDRSYDPSKKDFPDFNDVRLPNPLDTALLDKACFLRKGEIHIDSQS
jgi:replicative DNA helicase